MTRRNWTPLLHGYWNWRPLRVLLLAVAALGVLSLVIELGQRAVAVEAGVDAHEGRIRRLEQRVGDRAGNWTPHRACGPISVDQRSYGTPMRNRQYDWRDRPGRRGR